MNTCIGISRQTFLIIGTYMCVIVFHSASMISAAAAALSVLLVQAAFYLLLPFLTKRVNEKLLPSFCVIFTVIFAVFFYRLFGLLPLKELLLSSIPFPYTSYLLILVPICADQARHPGEYQPRLSAKIAGIFIGMLLFVSFLREAFGFGTLLGIRVMPEGSEPFILLTHVSGAAFLLLMLILLSLFFYRQITGKPQVLAVLEESVSFIQQPFLNRKEELDRLFTALYSLLFILPAMLSLYLLSVFVLPEEIPFDFLLVLAVFLQGLAGAILYWIPGKQKRCIRELFCFPWFIPAQTVVLILPYLQPYKSLFQGKGLLDGLIDIVLYVSCTWVLAVFLLLFRRSINRKLLFGKRPDLLSGIPFLLLIAALGLLVLSGFGTIPYALIQH